MRIQYTGKLRYTQARTLDLAEAKSFFLALFSIWSEQHAFHCDCEDGIRHRFRLDKALLAPALDKCCCLVPGNIKILHGPRSICAPSDSYSAPPKLSLRHVISDSLTTTLSRVGTHDQKSEHSPKLYETASIRAMYTHLFKILSRLAAYSSQKIKNKSKSCGKRVFKEFKSNFYKNPEDWKMAQALDLKR